MAGNFKIISENAKIRQRMGMRYVQMDPPMMWPLRAIQVDQAGIGRWRHPHTFAQSGDGHHRIIVVTGGEVDLATSLFREVVRAPQLLVVPAGISFQVTVRPGTFESAWFHLRDTRRWHHLRNRSIQSIRPGMSARTIMALESILLEQHIFIWPDTQRMVKACAETIAIYLERRLSSSMGVQEREILDRFTDLWEQVDSDLARAWCVQDLARGMNVSVSQLHRWTAKLFDASPMAMVTSLRMKRAEDLLLNTDASLGQVALRVGYATSFALSKAFKRHTGCHPKAFRRG